MSTYNGEIYLPEQIQSIISQMGEADELVVVDDASSDSTVNLLASIQDSRIRVYRNQSNIGHVQSFAKAISLARGAYILMADQDDVWIEGRVNSMLEALSFGPLLVSANSKFMDGNGKSIPPLHPILTENDSTRYFFNIFRIFTGCAYYDGCAMALREDLRRLILPIPDYVESHDLWIAMAANIVQSNRHLERFTLFRRVHGSNASIVNRSLFRKLRSRFVFLISLFHIIFRLIIRY
jgi:glycosyltransferase involved in cell wall biosynthesis